MSKKSIPVGTIDLGVPEVRQVLQAYLRGFLKEGVFTGRPSSTLYRKFCREKVREVIDEFRSNPKDTFVFLAQKYQALGRSMTKASFLTNIPINEEGCQMFYNIMCTSMKAGACGALLGSLYGIVFELSPEPSRPVNEKGLTMGIFEEELNQYTRDFAMARKELWHSKQTDIRANLDQMATAAFLVIHDADKMNVPVLKYAEGRPTVKCAQSTFQSLAFEAFTMGYGRTMITTSAFLERQSRLLF